MNDNNNNNESQPENASTKFISLNTIIIAIFGFMNLTSWPTQTQNYLFIYSVICEKKRKKSE